MRRFIIYTLTNIIWMRLAGHVEHMGHEKCIQNFKSENLKRRDHLGCLGIYERIILKCILIGCMWTGLG
jgi:hypothetical protein